MKTIRSILHSAGRTENAVQSPLTALEGMTAKNAFIVVRCAWFCLECTDFIPLIFNMAAWRARIPAFVASSVFILHRFCLHPKFLDTIWQLCIQKSLFLSSQLQTPNILPPCQQAGLTTYDLPLSCRGEGTQAPPARRTAPTMFPTPQRWEPNI